jgi:hypothetical protein
MKLICMSAAVIESYFWSSIASIETCVMHYLQPLGGNGDQVNVDGV